MVKVTKKKTGITGRRFITMTFKGRVKEEVIAEASKVMGKDKGFRVVHQGHTSRDYYYIEIEKKIKGES